MVRVQARKAVPLCADQVDVDVRTWEALLVKKAAINSGLAGLENLSQELDLCLAGLHPCHDFLGRFHNFRVMMTQQQIGNFYMKISPSNRTSSES